MADKTCFVVMGFGTKTDPATGRTLDLDKSYRVIIKPAVANAGLRCVRADDIIHAGSIDVTMYRQLLEADVVVADISTCNPNALYELGVRHALRPYTTIIIAEDKVADPFDVNHIVIRKYQHLGPGIDAEEAERFRAELTVALEMLVARTETDSPVYSSLAGLRPPIVEALAQHAAAAPDPPATDETLSSLTQRAPEIGPAVVRIGRAPGRGRRPFRLASSSERRRWCSRRASCATTTTSLSNWPSRPTRAACPPRWRLFVRPEQSLRGSTRRCRTTRRRLDSGVRRTSVSGRRPANERTSTRPSWPTSGASTSAPTTTTASTSHCS